MNKRSAVVLVPTIGLPLVKQAVESVLSQTHALTKCMVIIDGYQYEERVQHIFSKIKDPRLNVLTLPSNTGGKKFCGHRIYAALAHLVNEDYVLYLDEDNWLDATHVQSLIELIEQGDLQWAYSLRKIIQRNGRYLFNDDCQSLGKWPSWNGPDQWLVDTSCYCIRREVAIHTSSAWHNEHGADRLVYSFLQQNFPRYDTTGLYTLNYRIGSSQFSVPKEFLAHGNQIMKKRFSNGFPWSK